MIKEEHCVTCKYWQGDKEISISNYLENPVSMDLEAGWPEDGECWSDHAWFHIEVLGDATAKLVVDANFGCIHWDMG